MRSLDRKFLEQQAIPLEFAGTLRTLGEYRGKQEFFSRQTPQVLDTLKQVAIIQSTESSNRIEGVIVPGKRIKELLEKKTTPKNRPEAEVVGYAPGDPRKSPQGGQNRSDWGRSGSHVGET